MSRDRSEAVQELLDTMEHRRLEVFFQPVIDLSDGSIFGYEGLVIGPSDSLLHSPQWLYRLAKHNGLLLELENLCCHMVANRFVELKLHGTLFLKLNVDVFLEHKFKEIRVTQAIEKAGIDPERIYITLCAQNSCEIYNPDLLQKIISRYTELGYKVDLDDFSMLQSPSEIYPSCVKINSYLIHDIDKDPAKVSLIKSLLKIAASSGFKSLAEGIESRGELLLARDIGVSLGQGHFIAAHSKNPTRMTPRAIKDAYEESASAKGNAGIDAIMEKTPSFLLENNNEEVFQVFENSPQLSVVAVSNNGIPVGLINRSVFINRFARPYQRELFGKKSCTTFMDPDPLIVDKNISIQALSLLLARDQRHVSLGFIFTENGHYFGVGTSQNLIHEITDMQIQSARYANPLTGLPGNAPIDENIDALLMGGEKFCVCYFDLDNFKPFNDVYGFSMGDAMIQMTAKIITELCDPEIDFVGHIGGDDFIVLFCSADWEARCRSMLQRFGQDVMSFFNPSDITRGGYIIENRRGEKEFHNLTSLSIGIVPVEPKEFKSHRDVAVVAAQSKKMAKKIQGNSLFIDQRSYSLK